MTESNYWSPPPVLLLLSFPSDSSTGPPKPRACRPQHVALVNVASFFWCKTSLFKLHLIFFGHFLLFNSPGGWTGGENNLQHRVYVKQTSKSKKTVNAIYIKFTPQKMHKMWKALFISQYFCSFTAWCGDFSLKFFFFFLKFCKCQCNKHFKRKKEKHSIDLFFSLKAITAT